MAKYGLVRLSAYPQLVAEFDMEKNFPKVPEDYSHKNGKKVWWTCSRSHSWEAVVGSRVQGCGCPFCSGHKTWFGYNDLDTLKPELASQWDYSKNSSLTPREVTIQSNKKVWWLCSPNGHSWIAAICKRVSGRGCPMCSNKKVLVGFNDMAVTNPELASEWDYEANYPLTPHEVTLSTHKKLWWLCPTHQHSYQAYGYNRKKGLGCPYCSGQMVLQGFNDLESTHPMLSKEFDWELNYPTTPATLSRGHNTKIWWRCSQHHHSWEARPAGRTRGDGCPYCAGKAVLHGFNDMATTHPDMAIEFDLVKNFPLQPSKCLAGTHLNLWWLCQEQHSYRAAADSRLYRGTGCTYCANKKVLKGFNDMATTHPELALEFDLSGNSPNTPRNLVAGTAKTLWWKCSLGHSFSSSGDSRTNKKTNCPKCFDLRKHSKIEVALCQALGAGRDNTTLSIKWGNGHKYKVDGLLQDKVAIEYDGDYYHRILSDRRDKDIEKTINLIAHGYTVVRVREDDLPFLPTQEGLIQFRHMFDKDDIVETASKILHTLAEAGRLTTTPKETTHAD